MSIYSCFIVVFLIVELIGYINDLRFYHSYNWDWNKERDTLFTMHYGESLTEETKVPGKVRVFYLYPFSMIILLIALFSPLYD